MSYTEALAEINLELNNWSKNYISPSDLSITNIATAYANSTASSLPLRATMPIEIMKELYDNSWGYTKTNAW